MTAIQPDVRFKILKDVMLREDLADAERRIVWFLLFEAMNRKTGDCFPGDRTIAKLLHLNPGTVSRAKRRLRELKILDWKPDPKRGGSSSYWFSYGYDCTHADVQTVNMQTPPSAPTQTPPSAPTQTGGVSAPKQTPLSAPTQTPHTPSGMRHGPTKDGRFFVEYDTPQWDYWDAFLRKTKGTGAPRGNRGKGWIFDSEWPKEHVQ